MVSPTVDSSVTKKAGAGKQGVSQLPSIPIPANFASIGCVCGPEDSDGAGSVLVYIPAEVLKRLKTRAHSQDMATYLWENIFKRDLIGHVY